MKWWKWSLGMTGIYASILVVGCLLGDPWGSKSDLPVMILVAAILASIGGLMYQAERVDRLSRDDSEVRQLEKWYGNEQARTWKARLQAWLDGLE
jgi:hypothetical protein